MAVRAGGVAVSIADSENPIEEIVQDDARESRRGRYGWLSLVVAALFGLFYAYDVWEAIGNLFLLPGQLSQLGLDKYIPWAVLWVDLAVPVVVFAVAILVGRRRGVLARALILLCGLAVVAGLTMTLLGLATLSNPFLR